MRLFQGNESFESFYLKHFDSLQDLQNCTECFKNLSIYSSSIYYQVSQSNTGSFKRILTENDTWLDSNFWKNGGNYFTSSFKLGTLNTNELILITSGSSRLTISSFGNIDVTRSVTIGENLSINGQTYIFSALYDASTSAGNTNQFLRSNSTSGVQWTTIQMSHVSQLHNYTSSVNSSLSSLNSYTSSNNVSIINLNQVSSSFKTYTSSLNTWTGSVSSSLNSLNLYTSSFQTTFNNFSSSVNTQFINLNNSLNSYTSSNNLVINNFSSYTSSLNIATGSFFRQGGNSFGTTAILGTNDNNSLILETSGSSRAIISPTGEFTVFGVFEAKQNFLVRGSTFIFSALYDSSTSAGNTNEFLRSTSTNGALWTTIQMSHVSQLHNYTSSVSSSLNSLNLYTSSNNAVINNFSVYTSSFQTTYNNFSSSVNTQFNNTNSSLTSLNSYTASNNTIINNFSSYTSSLNIATGSFFRQGGNSFGATAILGTNDNQSLIFETSGSARLTILQNGNILVNTNTQNGYQVDINGSLRNTTAAYFSTTSGNFGIGTTNADVFSRGYNGKIVGITSTGQSNISLNSGIGWANYLDMGVNGVRTFNIYSDVISSDISTLGNTYLTLSTGGTVKMFISNNGNVGIGTSSPNNSAKLDITSTTSGVLFPRMTTTEKNNISALAGLVVYDTSLSKLQVYTTAWENLH